MVKAPVPYSTKLLTNISGSVMAVILNSLSLQIVYVHVHVQIHCVPMYPSVCG